jgi:hypothetical protein
MFVESVSPEPMILAVLAALSNHPAAVSAKILWASKRHDKNLRESPSNTACRPRPERLPASSRRVENLFNQDQSAQDATTVLAPEVFAAKHETLHTNPNRQRGPPQNRYQHATKGPSPPAAESHARQATATPTVVRVSPRLPA